MNLSTYALEVLAVLHLRELFVEAVSRVLEAGELSLDAFTFGYQ